METFPWNALTSIFLLVAVVIKGLTLLKLNSRSHLHSHRWIPGEAEGGGWKKSEYFVIMVMSDLSVDTSRILAHEQILTREGEGVVLHWCITSRSFQGHIKVLYYQGRTDINSENILFLSINGHFTIVFSQKLIRSLAEIADYICKIKRRSDGNYFMKRSSEHFVVSGRINKRVDDMGINMSPKQFPMGRLCNGYV